MKTTKTTPPTLAELEARIAAGEPVDPDEWMRARALAELSERRARAEREAAEREAEARRLAEIRQIRDTVLDAAADDDDTADIALIAEAAERIIRRHQRLADVVRDARTRLARLGVPERHTVEGIRWRQAGMGYADSVEVDGRMISIIATPGRPIAAALDDACRRAGVSPRLLGPFTQLSYSRPPTPEEREAVERRTAAARAAALARIAARPARTQQLSDHRSDQTGTSDTPHAEGRATGQDAPVARPATGQALDITSRHPGAMPVAGDSPTD